MPARFRTLAAWLLLLWGPLLWFAHFGFVYAAASLELTFRPQAGMPSRLAIAAATLVALSLLVCAAIWPDRFVPRDRSGELQRFWVAASRMLCLISGIAIVYQTLPALIVP